MRISIIRLEGERPLETSQSFVQFVLRSEDVSQIVVRRGIGCIPRKGLGYQLRGLFVLSELIGDNAQKMRSVDVVRIDRQYVTVSRFSLGQGPV